MGWGEHIHGQSRPATCLDAEDGVGVAPDQALGGDGA